MSPPSRGYDPGEFCLLCFIESRRNWDLRPIRVARALKVLIVKRGWSEFRLAEKVRLPLPAVRQRLALLQLTPDLQEDIEQGRLSEAMGVAIAHRIQEFPNDERMEVLARIRKRLDERRKPHGGFVAAGNTNAGGDQVQGGAVAKPDLGESPHADEIEPQEWAARVFANLDRLVMLARPQVRSFEVIARSAEILRAARSHARQEIEAAVFMLLILHDELDQLERGHGEARPIRMCLPWNRDRRKDA